MGRPKVNVDQIDALCRSAQRLKDNYDSMRLEMYTLLEADEDLQYHFQLSRLPRFYEKIQYCKGDVTPSMLVTATQIAKEYYEDEAAAA